MLLKMLLIIAYIIVALSFSLFYAIKAFEIFQVEISDKKWSWRIHQFWFNFLGSVAGWVAFWFLFRKVLYCIFTSCSAELDLGDMILFLFAFIGVTGHLPYTIMGLIQGIKELALKLLGLLKQ